MKTEIRLAEGRKDSIPQLGSRIIAAYISFIQNCTVPPLPLSQKGSIVDPIKVRPERKVSSRGPVKMCRKTVQGSLQVIGMLQSCAVLSK